jgi:hypothetical protein
MWSSFWHLGVVVLLGTAGMVNFRSPCRVKWHPGVGMYQLGQVEPLLHSWSSMSNCSRSSVSLDPCIGQGVP